MKNKTRDLLMNSKTEDLLAFLEEYAALDTKFENAVIVSFSEPDFEDELHKVRNMMDYALREALDCQRHDSWGVLRVNTSEICFVIEQRAKQGNIRLAFEEIEIVYRKLLGYFEFQSECEICDEAEFWLQFLADVAKEATDISDKEYIYEHCIELAYVDEGKDCGAEYEDLLLRIAVNFVTKKNRALLEEALAKFGIGRRAEKFIEIRTAIASRLEGKDESD